MQYFQTDILSYVDVCSTSGFEKSTICQFIPNLYRLRYECFKANYEWKIKYYIRRETKYVDLIKENMRKKNFQPAFKNY